MSTHKGTPRSVRSPGWIPTLLGVIYGLATTGTSALAVSLPQISGEFDISAGGAAWAISVYTVMLAVATPLHGRLADAYGLRVPLVVGVVTMAVGAVASALAPNFAFLIVARVVQGFGGASIAVLTTALLSVLWAEPQRGAALGRVTGVGATFSALGPLIGGALENIGGWRPAVALPALGLLALPYVARLAPSGGSGKRIDRTGALLVATAASGLVLLLQSPSSGPVTAITGAVLLAAGAPAVVARVRARPHGFLPRSVVTNPAVLHSAFAASAIPAGWFALLVGVPSVAAGWGWTPLATGLLMLPAAVVGLVAPSFCRRALARLGARPAITVACAIAALALPVAAVGVAMDFPPVLALGVALTAVAFGLGQPAMMSAVNEAVAATDRGVAIGVATLVSFTGASIGASLVGGLGGVASLSTVFLVLMTLPVLGLTVLRLAGRRRAALA
ncbi:MFS transporter [Streptomyces sp. 35G-GA-8]|uniref:MFS transporter n=1 Tax=Streptomyces sp. 35G-GA-8 TaxID=2939434 RepID=UPI00201F8539|nr:MFS transporter [Streptomyces sp. 35G-GA-8]MCL7379819.1 MFS transporter [Streptomyces sp. 35G-GA-8]